MTRIRLFGVALLSALAMTVPASTQSSDLSFFITSAGPGDGANLGGLDGADRHCQMLAQTAGAGETSIIQMFLPLILIFAVFYFLLIRPQQKKMKEHNALLEAIRRGDRIVTGGGIVGTVARVNDNELLVDISENVRVTVMRRTVADVLSKTEPVANDKPKANGEKSEGKRGRIRGGSRKNG